MSLYQASRASSQAIVIGSVRVIVALVPYTGFSHATKFFMNSTNYFGSIKLIDSYTEISVKNTWICEILNTNIQFLKNL